MPSAAKKNKSEHDLKLLTKRLEKGTLHQVRRLIATLRPAEIAHMLESLQPVDREVVWHIIEPAMTGEILVELNDEVRTTLIEATDTQDLISAAEGLQADDLADILQDLPDVVLRRILISMDKQDRLRLESVLSHHENTAGGLMNPDALTVRPDVTLDVVLRYLRLRGSMPEQTDSLIVVDRYDRYRGVLPLSLLLTHDEHNKVSELMLTHVEAVPVELSAADVAILFEQRDLVSVPVVDQKGKLLGRITVDDVVDVIRDEADHNIMRMAGLDEEQDMFAPVMLTAKRRAVWLGINLFTAFLAAWVIGLFQDSIEQIVALAVLMPVVASMGGIAGSQTLTIVIRGLALRQIGETNAHLLLGKELAVGAMNGILWAGVVAGVAFVWFQDAQLALLISVAILINLIVAALAGACIPLLLDRLKIDPALAGGVLLTTVTDVIGFVAFLGLATIFLL